jgi:DNA-binding PadR family transcriptional regulator
LTGELWLYRVFVVTRTRRPSAQTIAVLNALAHDPERWRYGYDLCTELGLQAGSVYPILIRLAERGLLETSWEAERATGRPPRHLYRLTDSGRVFAAELAAAPAGGTTSSARVVRRSALRWDGAR